jgi:ornithine cyclodeaminase/alanine dehydrogenase-like protein (mu-crystallin family)
VVNTREQLRLDHQGAIYSLLTSGRINESQILELAEVVGGKAKGRQGYGDITLYANNHGMGLQFAVAAHRIYERARTRGLGQYVDTELFH